MLLFKNSQSKVMKNKQIRNILIYLLSLVVINAPAFAQKEELSVDTTDVMKDKILRIEYIGDENVAGTLVIYGFIPVYIKNDHKKWNVFEGNTKITEIEFYNLVYGYETANQMIKEKKKSRSSRARNGLIVGCSGFGLIMLTIANDPDAQSIPPLAIIGMVASVSGPVYAIFQYLAPGGFGKFKKFMTAQEAREVATEYNKKLTNEMP